MTRWFVSRHPGAIEWAKKQNVAVDKWVSHLAVDQVQAGDVVMGTLPVRLAAEVCERNAEFYFLAVNVKEEQRGKELSLNEVEALDAKLMRFDVRAVE